MCFRMDPVLEAELPRLCRKGNQQGPQSDRTGQHTALGLQVRQGGEDPNVFYPPWVDRRHPWSANERCS
jgi:hypothetical protein